MKAAGAFILGGLLTAGLLGFGERASTPASAQPKAEQKKPFECHFAESKIAIDGVISEGAWNKADAIALAVPWQNRAAKTATKARLLWDKQYLYFCAEMEDQDLYADVEDANGKTWENDVFELFFKPEEKRLAYYEFQINAANTPLELFSRRAWSWRVSAACHSDGSACRVGRKAERHAQQLARHGQGLGGRGPHTLGGVQADRRQAAARR